MPNWEVATALGISLLVALTAHVFYRRPPARLWPSLPLIFTCALIFSVGDLIANLWRSNETALWSGMVLVYTGLLTIAPAWWLFSRNFAEVYGYKRVPFQAGLPVLLAVNSLLWIGLVSNPWHGLFIESHAGTRSTYGPLWYATASINYLALLAVLWVHARAMLGVDDPVIRSQCRFLVAAIAIPLSMNMVYVFSSTPLPYDPTALGFALSCTLFLFAVERRDLFMLERVSLPSVLSHDADSIVIVSEAGRLLFSNPAAKRLFGAGQLEPGTAIDRKLAHSIPTFRFEIARTDPQKVSSEEHRFISAAGDESWVTIEVTNIERSRGVPAGLSLRFRDQTAFRTARREAEGNLALLEALDLATGEGILVQNETGAIHYVNDAFGRLWMVPNEQLFDWGPSVADELAKLLAEPAHRSVVQLWYSHRDPATRDQRDINDLTLLDGRVLEVESFPIETEKGFKGRAWRVTDVTQARHESQAMIHSQKLESLGVLAGGIAHDFNNLLFAILGNAELAREELPSDSPVHGPLADVEAAATNASELTSQLLAYAGKTAFVREEVDLSELLTEVTSLLSVSIPKNIELKFDLAEEISMVRGGTAELRQVVMNLVTNAADAIGDDGGTIRIETGAGMPSPIPNAGAVIEHGEWCEPAVFLRVTDNGVGMDPRTLEKIFDPFFTTKFTGRGLGLAATRGILNSHDGLLRIETTLGIGSVFSVVLPAEQESASQEVEREATADQDRFVGFTVLIVDDEPSVRTVLTSRLEAAGFKVLTAVSGDAALDLMNEQPATVVDLVILDITMPGLSGIETHAKLRAMFPELPVLLSSGYPEEALATIESGEPSLDAFIQKPYRNTTLFGQIERLLKRNRDSKNRS